MCDRFCHGHAFEGVKLFNMGLEFSIVLKRFFVSEVIELLFEQYDSSCIIANGKYMSCRVELDSVDDILLLDGFVRLRAAEDLVLGKVHGGDGIKWRTGEAR